MNRLAIITGGSKGLGRELLQHYRQQQWTVLDLSRSGAGPDHLAVDLATLDASLAAIRIRFAALAQSSWQRVVFISNAGMITPIAPVQRLDDAALLANLQVNFTAPIRLITAFMHAFAVVQADKTVANISSGAATRGMYGWSLYCASKAGTENFINALAAEQYAAAAPATCINISPGIIDTSMQAQIREAAPADFDDVERFIEFKQAGQLRPPQVVAAAIARIIDSQPDNGGRYTIDAYL